MNASSSACRLLACHRFVLPSHEANKPERHVNRKQRDFYDVKHERHHHTSTAMAAEFHQQQPLDLKMVFLGDSAVGKTALLRRFNTGFPPEEDQPAPADAYSFTDSIQLDGKRYLVRCWEWDSGRKDTNVSGLFRTQEQTLFCYVLTLKIERLSPTSKIHGSQKFVITCHILLS